MAGGFGTRFWPESTQKKPKQFLSLFGQQTMLQRTVNRIQSLIPPKQTWIITNQRYVSLAQEQLPEVPEENIIGEPVAKDTAPCVAAASTLIHRQDPDATMVVLPADHLINDAEEFLSILQAGAEKARRSDSLITIGIKPTRPETGYGYIEFDEDSSESVDNYQLKRVNQFREKPDIATAKQFISAGRFLWNSGMFIWTVPTIRDVFQRYLPEIANAAAGLQMARKENQEEALELFYQSSPSISIDYGIMEKARQVFVIPGDFGWSDVGSWRALYELSDKDENKNVLQKKRTVTESSSGNIVRGTGNKMIALAGVENLAVVETEDAILVCDLEQTQSVKQIVKKLKGGDHTEKFL
jgi:mannose-1-phosphate guanylyltransferase